MSDNQDKLDRMKGDGIKIGNAEHKISEEFILLISLFKSVIISPSTSLCQLIVLPLIDTTAPV